MKFSILERIRKESHFLQWKVLSGFFSLTFLLIVASIISGYWILGLRQSGVMVEHTFAVIQQIDECKTQAREIEISQTYKKEGPAKDPDLLFGNIRREISTLMELTEDNKIQSIRVLNILNLLVEAEKRPRSYESKIKVKEIISFLTGMEEEELKVLNQRNSKNLQRSAQAAYSLFLLVLLSFIVVG